MQKICSFKCQFSAPEYEPLPRLVCQVHMIAGQNKCKEKVPDVSDPNQMLKQHATPNSSLHNLKIYSSKECRKTSQR